MTLVIEDCKVILSDDGGHLTLNVELEDEMSTAAYPISLGDGVETHLLENYFERHGEER